MKYSISVLSSVSFACPVRILNCAMYLSAVSFPCLRCCNCAHASPLASAAEKAFCDEVGIASIGSILLVHENFFPCFCCSLSHIGEYEEDLLLVCAEDLSVEIEVGVACLDEFVEIVSISIKCFRVVESDLFGCGGSHIVFWFFITVIPVKLFSSCGDSR